MSNFKKARTAKGLSQKEIAISIGVSGPTVSDWERGVKTPAGKNLKKLTELLNCSSDYLLGISPNEEQEKPIQMDGLTPDKAEFIALVQQMTPEQVRALIAVAKLTLRDQ